MSAQSESVVLFVDMLGFAPLLEETLEGGVPARMGIAAGSFAALRFMTDNTTAAHVYSTQFLGTAVVRAYQAEKCGIQGLRILLHQSMRPLMMNEANNKF
jgi:hypothetical protein